MLFPHLYTLRPKTNKPIQHLFSQKTLGFVHVLTGPDHLSALATLSANTQNRYEAFLLGVRWGIGHSTGLLVVGGIFLLISASVSSTSDDGDNPIHFPEYVSHFCESVVGFFMIALGSYGIHRASTKRQQAMMNQNNNRYILSTLTDSNNDSDAVQQEVTNEMDDSQPIATQQSNRLSFWELTPYHDHYDTEHMTPSHRNHHPLSGTNNDNELENYHSTTNSTFVATDAQMHPIETKYNLFHHFLSQISARTMAFFAGVIHGIAGPGGVLGVIPAVQLHDWKLASIYLSCFCLSSMFTMGIFAMFYGSVSYVVSSRGNRDRSYVIECVSASLSIVVGILWLFLLSIGKLDEVFP